jgi:hypothetical protein
VTVFRDFASLWRTVPQSGAHTDPECRRVGHILDEWLRAANITSGKLFRRLNKIGTASAEGLTQKVVWQIAGEYPAKTGIEPIATWLAWPSHMDAGLEGSALQRSGSLIYHAIRVRTRQCLPLKEFGPLILLLCIRFSPRHSGQTAMFFVSH